MTSGLKRVVLNKLAKEKWDLLNTDTWADLRKKLTFGIRPEIQEPNDLWLDSIECAVDIAFEAERERVKKAIEFVEKQGSWKAFKEFAEKEKRLLLEKYNALGKRKHAWQKQGKWLLESEKKRPAC